MNIGWIGLGNMGIPMVRNAVRAGLTVRAFNRTPKSADLGGATKVDTLAEAVRNQDVVVLMVSDGNAVHDILLRQGMLDELSPNTLVINMSTIGVDETLDAAKEVTRRGHRYLDAPVLGSVKPAMDATLTVVSGGEKEDFEFARALFDAIAKTACHVGPLGKGAVMKLLVNAFLGLSVEALGETLSFGTKNGLQPELIYDVLQNSAVWSPMLAGKRSLVLESNYQPQFALSHLRKDLGLVIRQSEAVKAEMPAIRATSQTFERAQQSGYGKMDMASIVSFLLQSEEK